MNLVERMSISPQCVRIYFGGDIQEDSLHKFLDDLSSECSGFTVTTGEGFFRGDNTLYFEKSYQIEIFTTDPVFRDKVKKLLNIYREELDNQEKFLIVQFPVVMELF